MWDWGALYRVFSRVWEPENSEFIPRYNRAHYSGESGKQLLHTRFAFKMSYFSRGSVYVGYPSAYMRN